MPARLASRIPSAARATVLACLVVFAVPAAGASLAGALRGSPFEFFTEEDTRQFIAAARALVEAEKPGESKRWANEASGSWGTMAVRRSFRRNGAPCREIRGENTARGRTEAFRLVLCQTKEGEWKIASSGSAKP